jgi:enamine deaminase RidA (YjgF/YER057c/UK114 family)
MEETIMLKHHNPLDVPPPTSLISQAIEVAPGARWLYLSGQIAVGPDGTVIEGAEAQMEDIWGKIGRILDAAGMGYENLVKICVFLTSADDIAMFRQVRDRVLGAVKPASTLLVVKRLASPELLVEIEAVAAAE